MRWFGVLFLCGILLSGFAGVTALAKSKAAKAEWVPVCLKTEAGKLLGCRLLRRVVVSQNKKRKLVLAAQIRRPLKGKPYIHLLLPLGLNLSAGVVVAVLDAKAKKAKVAYKTAYQTCIEKGCIATLPLPGRLLGALNSSDVMRVTFANLKKKNISVSLSLKGFSAAYKGLDSQLK